MTNMRKLYQSVLALSLLTTPISTVAFADTPSSSATVSPQSAVSVTIDGNVQTYDPAPEIVNGRTLVPLRGIFEALGAKVNWDQVTETVTATKGTTNIQLTIGSYSAEVNGTGTILDQKPQLKNGRTMIPIRFVSEALGAIVRWHEESNTVAIYTNVNNANTDQQNNNDSNSNSPQLSYQQALDLAMKNSITLKNASAAIDRAFEVKQDAGKDVTFIPSDGSNPQAASAYKGAVQSELGYQSSKWQYEITQDSVAYSVKKSYYEILQDLEKKKLADLTLDNANQQLQLINAKFQNGLASQFDVTQAQNNADSANAKHQAALKTLDDAYQKFNQLVGFEPEDKPQLIDQPTFEKLDQVDLNNHVNRAISSSPVLKIKDQQVDLAQLALNLYTYNSGSDSYAAKQIDETTSQNNVTNTKNQLDQSIRTIYYSIKQMEDQYSVLQSSLNSAEQSLKQTEVKYDTGMAIKADLTNAQLTVEQLKQQMYDLIVQHELAKITFDKPWVAAGGASS